MKKILIRIGFMGAILLTSCDILDFNEPDPNPNLSEDAILNSENSMAGWVLGIQRQFVEVHNGYVVMSSLMTDNYDFQGAQVNSALNLPEAQSSFLEMYEMLQPLHQLREMGKYGIETVSQRDENSTADQLAFCHFFIGFSHLIQAELFTMAILEPDGTPVTPAEAFNAAITSLKTAHDGTSDANLKTRCLYALARANYGAGNKSEATSYASQALASDPTYVYRELPDNASGTSSNYMQAVIYNGGNQGWQPLPRLDFLDPKYAGTNSTAFADQDGYITLKSEEAHLILAEAANADGDLTSQKSHMENLLALVKSRPIDSVLETDARRNDLHSGIQRPNSDDISVKASADDEARSGLILNRVGAFDVPVVVAVPSVSGTSVTSEMIQALSTADEALELLYLMRQEILIAEGRRMFDLGMRFPCNTDEIDLNPNVNAGDPITKPLFPSYIPRDEEMNAYTWDEAGKLVTILHNMNTVIVANKTSSTACPFH
ncbi:MAG: hypothetical protein QF842_02825 [Candidatus Marinimicrobia bacterium]|jgi:hypothetical protein|nr:hypothetical protein [Candidatus Neomarinimicrobiota bacterium]MDP6611118.1 hypothetical protein [Candidatus Neomarinimicrobiota bacterium]|tara:strand:+ start:7447 stop:8916 length:1470 start_codon:yes stop_codon:yes gene_type:complete